MELKGIAAAFLVLCAAQFAATITDGLLSNGNFEKGPTLSSMNGTRVVGPDAIPGWRTSGFIEYVKAGQKQGDMLLVVPEGAAAVRLGNEASITQRLPHLLPSTRYSITFSAARTCAQDERINISVTPGRAADVLPMQTMYSSNGWDSYSWAWTSAPSAAAAAADLVIHNPGVTDDAACGPLIDSVAIKALSPPRITNKNLIKNGGFEEGPYILPNTSWGVLVPPHIEDERSPLPGWVVQSLKAVKYLDADHFAVPGGRRAVELLAGKESIIVQTVRTKVGRAYVLAFAVGDARNACKGSMVVEAYAAQGSVKVPYTSTGTGGSKRAALPFTAVAERTNVVFLSSFYHVRSDDLSSLCGPVVDDVTVVSVHRAA